MTIGATKRKVTIPKPVHDHLRIELRDTVDFASTEDGRVVPVKVAGDPPCSRFAALRGSADAGLSTDEVMALTRADL
jgi:bifunctional DNA-binding transcriptional regulator/antitoxin component of YhaV-PrlF toxin-antitoxin module